MSENILRRLEIKKLKGLIDVNITFANTLTAIMGVNGSGKTTILHALACMYQKERYGEEYKFSNFFVPNPDSQWAGSELRAVYWQGEMTKAGKRRLRTKIFTKKRDRWADYSARPKRDVFYLGIDTCLPEIERKKQNAFVSYQTQLRDDRTSKKVINKAAYILEKSYKSLLEHTVKNKRLSGVELSDGLKYSALSMGTGEQRVIKILNTIFNAQNCSLILIDEIDLLLHVNAFKKLLFIINEEAKRKKLQVIFTTHALMIKEFNFVEIRYIENTPTKTLVYTDINTGMIYSMTGVESRGIKVYVEDAFAQAIVKKIAKELNILKKITVHLFGSAQNAFTLAASIILKNESRENVLIVLDGDKYISSDEKKTQIQKALSGTEKDIDTRWNQALSLISQFSLPNNCRHPENFVHNLLIDEDQDTNEFVILAREIRVVDDKHSFINDIVERLGDSYDVLVDNILSIVSETDEWANFTINIRNWLRERREI